MPVAGHTACRVGRYATFCRLAGVDPYADAKAASHNADPSMADYQLPPVDGLDLW